MSRGLTIVSLLSIFLSSNVCSPKKKSVNDPVWREESLKMASGICRKISECIQASPVWKQENEIHTKLIEDRFQEAKCQEYHRNSNVYQLIGRDVESIKSVTRSCYKEVLYLNCEAIMKNALAKVDSCNQMEAIQKGSN